MKPGPAKKPSRIKEIEGNAGKRPLPATEPKPALDARKPKCPAYLKGPGRLEWKRITPELYRLGLLTKIDHAALEAYCSAYGQFIEVEGEMARMRREYREALRERRKKPYDQRKLPSNGMVVMTSNGNAIMEPILSVRKQAMELMHKFLVEFGMTPASRTRVTGEAGGKEKARSPMQRLMEANRDLVN